MRKLRHLYQWLYSYHLISGLLKMLLGGCLSTSDGGQKSTKKEMNNGSMRVMTARSELVKQTLLSSGWPSMLIQLFGYSLDLLIWWALSSCGLYFAEFASHFHSPMLWASIIAKKIKNQSYHLLFRNRHKAFCQK